MEIKALKIGDLTAKVPIIQGGMGVGVSGYKLASAVANAGGIGIISGAGCGYREPDFNTNSKEANLRGFSKEIVKAKENTKGIIGVNIMVAMENYKELVKVAVEEKVDLIISGAGLPVDLPELVEGSKVKIAPIVSSLRALELIVKRWKKKYDREPDAIIVEGPKAGGHLGFKKEDLLDGNCQSIFELVTEIKKNIKDKMPKVPVIAAGGIFDGTDIVKAIKAGADGVQMASRFVATYECDASECYKQLYVDTKEEDIVIMDSPVGLPGRAVKNPMLEKVMEGERIKVKRCYNCVRKCNPKDTSFCITEALINAVTGDLDNALLFVGERVSEIDKICHVDELIGELMKEVKEN